MISDVLSEAVSEIEKYLKMFPKAYKGVMKKKIIELKEHMEKIRIELDTPPH